jgi:hypothetical protein
VNPVPRRHLTLLFDDSKVLSIFAVTWDWVGVLPFLFLTTIAVAATGPFSSSFDQRLVW